MDASQRPMEYRLSKWQWEILCLAPEILTLSQWEVHYTLSLEPRGASDPVPSCSVRPLRLTAFNPI
jgi:hypothetical protein